MERGREGVREEGVREEERGRGRKNIMCAEMVNIHI